jgi:hypothetical protein
VALGGELSVIIRSLLEGLDLDYRTDGGTKGWRPFTAMYAPNTAFRIVTTRKMIDSTMPAIAVPRRWGPSPFMPRTRPAIVVGKPNSGMIHVTMEITPRTRLAVALPLVPSLGSARSQL